VYLTYYLKSKDIFFVEFLENKARTQFSNFSSY